MLFSRGTGPAQGDLVERENWKKYCDLTLLPPSELLLGLPETFLWPNPGGSQKALKSFNTHCVRPGGEWVLVSKEKKLSTSSKRKA